MEINLKKHTVMTLWKISIEELALFQNEFKFTKFPKFHNHGHYRMAVGFITTYAISAYHH
jgi:hypothetical protein